MRNCIKKWGKKFAVLNVFLGRTLYLKYDISREMLIWGEGMERLNSLA